MGMILLNYVSVGLSTLVLWFFSKLDIVGTWKNFKLREDFYFEDIIIANNALIMFKDYLKVINLSKDWYLSLFHTKIL